MQTGHAFWKSQEAHKKKNAPSPKELLSLFAIRSILFFFHFFIHPFLFLFFCTQIRHLFILFDLSCTNFLVSSIERYLNMENYQFARVCKDRKEDCNIDQYPLVKITGQQCLQSPLTSRAMHQNLSLRELLDLRQLETEESRIW